MILQKFISIAQRLRTKLGQSRTKKMRAGRNTNPQQGGVGGVLFGAKMGVRSCNQAFCNCC